MKAVFLAALAVFYKDFLLEVRTRYGINTILLFVLISVSLLTFSLAGETLQKELLAALLWNTIFFTAMVALQRGFVSEVERGTALFLALSATPAAIFLGKMLYNLILAMLVNVLIAVLYVATLNLEIVNWAIFLLALLLGSIGAATSLTLIGVIVANTTARGGLFAVLSFPILLPLLLLVVRATKIATMDDAPFARAETEMQLLAAYSLLTFTLSLVLFDYIWEV
ncbi:MAG: heme exporter protein CcmB [Chloroherpetonaceae bacterium]|nr:heme exporter protein CcmB [Chloroherpetonaceae bacterium]MCS7211315.1 heme exporter protein CcmB [Chloroherpetonaceae bacterium]MDW8020288.1 heme exporter protein CcmB [Chloroherpetonaceae bacterium]MDW8466518.1 heme exporter protein CcmB [Chloroherpetonaceae bacterium]